MTYLTDPQTAAIRHCEFCQRNPAIRVVDYVDRLGRWAAADLCAGCIEGR